MGPGCAPGVVRYNGPMETFDRTYTASRVMHSFRGTMPSGTDLGTTLADTTFTSASLTPTILVGVSVAMLAIGFFVWKALRQCGPDAWQPRLRGKFEWSLLQHRLVLALGCLLFLCGFAASILVLAQTTQTARLHVTLQEVHESSQTLVKAIQKDMDTAEGYALETSIQAREGVLWLDAEHAKLGLAVTGSSATVDAGDVAAEEAAHSALRADIADVAIDADLVRSSVGVTRGRINAELNSTLFADLRDRARPYWDTAVLLSHLAWGFIGGSLSGIVAKLLYDYSRLYRVKVEAKSADSAAEGKDAAVLLKVFDAGTRVAAWTSLSLLVILSVVFALSASYMSVICTEPYTLAAAYVRKSGSADLSTYYLECSASAEVYYCANPMAVDIAIVDTTFETTTQSIEATRVSYREYQKAYADVGRWLTPEPTLKASPQMIAISESEQAFEEAVRVAVYGVADCGTVGPLFDREIARVCDDQGRWMMTTAICSLVVVCTFFALAILAALMADAVKYTLYRKRDIENSGGRSRIAIPPVIYNGRRRENPKVEKRQKANPRKGRWARRQRKPAPN